AQVMMLEPRVLLLDEPMAGIDPSLAEEITDRLRSLRDAGVTILLVEHNLPAVLELCDHLTVLASGRILAEGAPREVLQIPAVVEAFLGACPAAHQPAAGRARRRGLHAAHPRPGLRLRPAADAARRRRGRPGRQGLHGDRAERFR